MPCEKTETYWKRTLIVYSEPPQEKTARRFTFWNRRAFCKFMLFMGDDKISSVHRKRYESGCFSWTEPCGQGYFHPQGAKHMKQKNNLTSSEGRANMATGTSPVHLENEISALPTVQADREFTTTNGCHVRLYFNKENDPKIRKEIARLLLTAFEMERNADDETSHVSVQGIDEGTGR